MDNRSIKIKTVVTLILSLTIILTIQNCERDDICAESTATTPRLLIEFYDVDNPDDLKNVPRLTIYGDSPDITIPDNDDFSGAILVDPFGSERIFNSNTSAAGLPLIIGNEQELTTTRFILERDTNLRLDTEDPETSNIDILEISYLPEFVYVSRACGYKSIFNNIDISTESVDGSDWIINTEIVVTNVENEDTVHVRIFH